MRASRRDDTDDVDAPTTRLARDGHASDARYDISRRTRERPRARGDARDVVRVHERRPVGTRAKTKRANEAREDVQNIMFSVRRARAWATIVGYD